MSALQTGVDEDDDKETGFKTYHFSQKTSIPSYLIAIAVGNLVGQEIGPRSTVWCEPEMIKQAAWEFSVTQIKRRIIQRGCLFIHCTFRILNRL
jgi:leukotriene-A4 hydrolase